MKNLRIVLVTAVALSFFPLISPLRAKAQAQFGPALHWRNIGPFRGGRTRAITGVPSQPSVFYMAQNNGGVWKTTDAGRVWYPIFDDQPTGSVGALAVSESNPNVVYVGSGDPRTVAGWKSVRARVVKEHTDSPYVEYWDRLIEGLRKAGLQEE